MKELLIRERSKPHFIESIYRPSKHLASHKHQNPLADGFLEKQRCVRVCSQRTERPRRAKSQSQMSMRGEHTLRSNPFNGYAGAQCIIKVLIFIQCWFLSNVLSLHERRLWKGTSSGETVWNKNIIFKTTSAATGRNCSWHPTWARTAGVPHIEKCGGEWCGRKEAVPPIYT